jgi:hypothetical protein
MKTIWKFPLKIADRQEVAMPADAKALTVQLQGGVPCLWALVDSGNPPKQYPVWMHGTGHDATDASYMGRYLSTIQIKGGALIFHFFIRDGA